MQKAAAPTATPENQARLRSQPDAIRATPATQSGSRCVQIPRLPRETKVDVSKCHACHAKCSYCHAKCENQARRRSQPDAIRATPATQTGSRCVQAPSLPRETKVDVSKCHACHAKCCYMSPSATPATHLCLSKLCVSKLCVDKLCVCVSKLCVDKLCVDKLCVDKLCVSKLRVDKLCVSKLCVSKLCVSKLCVDKLCVCE